MYTYTELLKQGKVYVVFDCFTLEILGAYRTIGWANRKLKQECIERKAVQWIKIDCPQYTNIIKRLGLDPYE